MCPTYEFSPVCTLASEAGADKSNTIVNVLSTVEFERMAFWVAV